MKSEGQPKILETLPTKLLHRRHWLFENVIGVWCFKSLYM